jgi:hypothetical protein
MCADIHLHRSLAPSVNVFYWAQCCVGSREEILSHPEAGAVEAFRVCLQSTQFISCASFPHHTVLIMPQLTCG